MSHLPPPASRAGSFPGRGGGRFPSIGSIRLFGLDGSGPHIEFIGVDDNTEVWRSNPIVVGSRDDLFGTPIGPPGSDLIAVGGDYRSLPQLPIPADLGSGIRRKFLAELHSLALKQGEMELLAGERFRRHLYEECELNDDEVTRLFRRSFGAVISRSLTGEPELDYPADNYFNVFFGLKIPVQNGPGTVTLMNKDPVLVVDLGIPTVPPLGRVTIPQFPMDRMELYYVHDPDGKGDPGTVPAYEGGCCAHSVDKPRFGPDMDARWSGRPVTEQLAFASIDLDLLLGHTRDPGQAEDMPIWPYHLSAQSRMQEFATSFFRPLTAPFIDGVFHPSGITQITSTGLVIEFPRAPSRFATYAITSGTSGRLPDAQPAPIELDPPIKLNIYGPPQVGLGLGPNAGITFDLHAIRSAFPDFYLVSLVGLEGMSRESPPGASVRVQVLVDGVAVPFADNTFTTPGQSAPIQIDLQHLPRFLTIVATPARHRSTVGNAAVALFELRGFGRI